ncbi:MAG TPA: hypothetical protein VGZ47_01040 [Gemmataceae bacterium]|jgi:hypothetical protein|nr:hypothetical protein [Gemmataceae bacterium]
MRRLIKTLKYLVLTIVFLAALLSIANAYLVWRTGTRLEERLNKLRTAGAPVSLAEIGAAPAVPGKNAADVLENIKPELQALIKEINPVLSKATADNSRPDPFPEDDRKTLEQAFANHPKVLPALQEAAECTVYHSRLNYQVATHAYLGELLPWVQLLREAINALDTQERLQLQRKDRDGAMRSCLTALQLTRVCDGEPMIISHLVILATRSVGVRMANEVLRAGSVSPELHRELETELAKHDSIDGLRRSLVTERVFGLQSMDEQMGGSWITRAYVNDNKCQYLDLMDEWIEKAGVPYAQFKEQEIGIQQGTITFRYVLLKLLAPAVMKIQEAEFRTRCMVRCLRVLNALMAKKLSEPPAKLTELGLPADTTTDPYTGQPLVVKKVDGQWLIYGLGPNLKDDGGKLDNYDDVGLGPVKK